MAHRKAAFPLPSLGTWQGLLSQGVFRRRKGGKAANGSWRGTGRSLGRSTRSMSLKTTLSTAPLQRPLVTVRRPLVAPPSAGLRVPKAIRRTRPPLALMEGHTDISCPAPPSTSVPCVQSLAHTPHQGRPLAHACTRAPAEVLRICARCVQMPIEVKISAKYENAEDKSSSKEKSPDTGTKLQVRGGVRTSSMRICKHCPPLPHSYTHTHTHIIVGLRR